MLTVKGIGETKFERYGQEFMALIRKYMADTDQQTAATTVPDTGAAQAKTKDVPSHLLTLELLNSGLTLEQIACKRKLKLPTVQHHLLRCGAEGHAVNWNYLFRPNMSSLLWTKLRPSSPLN